MSQRKVKTTFEAGNVIQPFYTGGPVAVDKRGLILATCLGETVILSSLQDGKPLARLEGDGESITSMAITPLSTHLIVCSRSLSMRIYALDVLDGALELETILSRTLKPFSTPVVASCVDDSGTLLATGSSDGSLKVWNIVGGYVSHTFKAHSGVVSSLKFFQPSQVDQTPGKTTATELKRVFRLVSGGDDGKIKIWDLPKRALLTSLDAHSSAVTSIDYSPEENSIVSGSRDKTLGIWDPRTGKNRKIIPVFETIESIGVLAGGKLAYCGGEHGHVRLWELSSGKEITSVPEDAVTEGGFVSILFSQDTRVLVCVREDFLFELRDVSIVDEYRSSDTIEDLPLIRRISGTHDEIIDLAFVGPQRNLMALATNTESIKVIDVRSAEERKNQTEQDSSFGSDVALLEGHDDIILCLDVDPSGHWLVTGAKDNTARLWRIDDESQAFVCTTLFTGHAGSIGAITLTPGSSKEISKLGYSAAPPRFVITGSEDKTIKRWDVQLSSDPDEVFNQSRATYTRKAHDKDINALVTSADSQLCASASQDRLVKIWSVEEGEVQGVLRGHKRGVWAVSFAPSGTPALSGQSGPENSKRGFILTGSGDRTVKIWSLADYNCVRSFEGHVNSILKVVWIPPPDTGASNLSSKRPYLVASAGGDGLVKVWDTQSSECLCTLDNHTERVWALAFDALSQRLVSGGGDGVVTFWTDTTETTMTTAIAESTARVEQEQQLVNHVHRGNYRDAILLALRLDHPARLLSLFSSIVKRSPPEDGSMSGVKAVDEAIAGLSDDDLFTLMLRLRDWNANARSSPVAQKILWVVFKTFPANKLVEIRKNGKNLADILDGLQAYTERHFRRTDELLEESYLIDFVVRSMEESGFVSDTDALGDGVLGGNNETVMVE